MRSSRPAPSQGRRSGKDAQTPLYELLPAGLPAVVRVQEPGPLLKAHPILQQPGVLALEYINGCGHACPFCPVRIAGDGQPFREVRLAANAVERLTHELHDMPPPSAVFVSPSTDPFPPLQEIQRESARLVEVLASQGIDVWLMTRGFIRPAVMDILGRRAGRIKVTMAMTTLDRPLQRLLEPLTAPPRLRLRTIQRLGEAGIACNAALEPLIPGVTDTRTNLLPLLEGLASVGIRHVTVGYLVLHQHNEEHLRSTLRPQGLDALVMDEYARGPILRSGRGLTGRYLPRSRRQHGYAALMAMAAGLGLRITVNALTNPDFTAVQPVETRSLTLPSLQIAGKP